MPGPKRFRTAPAVPSSAGSGLEDAAVRLVAHESRREVAAIPYDDSSSTTRRAGRVALHNGRFLRATLQSTETHNRRLAGEDPRRPQARTRPAPRAARDRSPPPPAVDGPTRVEIILTEDRDAGILFEKDAETGRPVVRSLTASARPDVTRTVRPGMVLSRIAGVKCKPVPYEAALDLLRTLDRPLQLTFKVPRQVVHRTSANKRARRDEPPEADNDGANNSKSVKSSRKDARSSSPRRASGLRR